MELSDTVRLMGDPTEEGLSAGAVGAVMHLFHQPNPAYEVEFIDERGHTVAQIPLTPDQIHQLTASDA